MTMTPKEVRAMWADDLEHGGHKQGRQQLGDDSRGWCCLGRLEKLAEEHGVIDSYDPVRAGIRPEVQRWAGIYSLGDYYKNGRPSTLARENDAGLSFPEIAAIIRAEPDGLCVA